MRRINKIILHCSASDNPAHDSWQVIEEWHLERVPPFDGIGYHYVITYDGVEHECRPIEKQGAHCLGQNPHSIGICLTGKWRFSDKQYDSMVSLVLKYCREFNLDPSRDVYPHSAFDRRKTCPNFEFEYLIRSAV